MSFAKEVAAQMQSLRIFEARREAKASVLLDYPSWVPDLSWGITAVPLEAEIELSFNASAGRKYTRHSEEKASEMVVVGKILDQVHDIVDHEFSYEEEDLHEYLGLKTLFPDMIDHLANRMTHKESEEETKRTHIELVLMRTIIADSLLPYGETPTAEEFVQLVKRLLAQNLFPSSEEQQAIAIQDIDIIRALRLQSVVCVCRRLCILDKHLVALGPQNARVGDYVCILLGSTAPYLLRPHGE